MALRAAIERVLHDYQRSTLEPFPGHPVAKLLRRDLAEEVAKALGPSNDDLVVAGSAGQGNWADVPWCAIYEPTVTSSAQRGFYPVYLFSVRGANVVHLSLNQGTTNVRREFGRQTSAVLRDRAELMRARLSDYLIRLPLHSIGGLSRSGLGKDYEDGHALGWTYSLGNLPTEDELIADLRLMAQCYRSLIYRGGLDFSAEDRSSPASDTVEEQRRLRQHYRIERNSSVSARVKACHGTTCQCCGFDFEQAYGELGVGFIEVHHLQPLASFEPGARVVYDIVQDFAVLCANCHRMIHRMDNPDDLVGLRKLIANLR